MTRHNFVFYIGAHQCVRALCAPMKNFCSNFLYSMLCLVSYILFRFYALSLSCRYRQVRPYRKNRRDTIKHEKLSLKEYLKEKISDMLPWFLIVLESLLAPTRISFYSNNGKKKKKKRRETPIGAALLFFFPSFICVFKCVWLVWERQTPQK
jgi:hypothetical protein